MHIAGINWVAVLAAAVAFLAADRPEGMERGEAH